MIMQERLIQKINALPIGKLSEVENFVDSLSENAVSEIRAERARSIAEYAAANAGTRFDLDKDLEAAGIECLLALDEDRDP